MSDETDVVRDYDPQVSTINKYGEWTPAIPLPLFIGYRGRISECKCGEKFRTQLAYRGHFALVHILGLS